ncbi:MAG: GNAT family N-acetyltransferase [Myxococcota bacterium]
MKPELARPDDADSVYRLLNDAAVWLEARGIEQWKPGALPRAVVSGGIRAARVFVVRASDALIATLQLEDSDPATWGADAGDALYLHRLCVARTHAGDGLGLRLLDWAAATARARGRRLLRLDCVASNDALRRYYARAGFAERGEVDVGVRLARFERVA